jgi:predicted RNA binding protein YcfA (HicA-like mRNA interferase family)
MFIIPDISYFAIPGFVQKMNSYTNRSSSLILHNRLDDIWDKLLRQEDAYLITWLHNKSDYSHNIFLPYSPNETFLWNAYDHFQELIEPAMQRIKSYLLELGADDINEMMSDAKEWLPLLFGLNQYHFSAELIAEYLGLRKDNFPMILIWTDSTKKDLILIYPNETDDNMIEYVKSLYWCIIKATNATKKKRLNIQDLLRNIIKKFDESHHIKHYEQKVRNIRIIQSPDSINDGLIAIGEQYKDFFDTAILNFEEYVDDSWEDNQSVVRLCDESKRSIISRLASYGFEKLREGANHEVWKHPNLNKPTPVPRHSKLTPFVMRSIQQDIQAAIA